MEPARFRPKTFPAPEFPARKPRRFARTPPAIFPVILGLLGLGLALRRGLAAFGGPAELADLVLGMAAMVWAFAVLAYLAKLAQRAAALAEDLRVLPGRTGLAAASMGGMAVAAALVPVAPTLAGGVLVASLLTHAALALGLLAVLLRLPPVARPVDPGWHLCFVGFIVGGIAASGLGWMTLATGLLYATIPVAMTIWAASLRQMTKALPPAPLRPLLAIHLAPAALFATVAALTGQGAVAIVALGFGAMMLALLVARGRWIVAAGFSPMWGAFTFPLAAYGSALLLNGAVWAGLALLTVAAIAIPAIAWRMFTLWGSGALAAKTNAAEA